VRDVHNRREISDWARAASNYWPDEPRRIERFTLAAWMEQITIPGAIISAELAGTLVARTGQTLEQLAAEAEAATKGLGVRALPGTRVSITTAVDRHITPARNILAAVEGSDSTLRDEAVIIVAHHDHNGAVGDTVYNGADDNASGTVGLLAVAEAYARAAADGERPRRSVVFAITDAEERGPSLGAWYLTIDPPFPLRSTAAVFNVDMIGRDQEVPENGGGRFAGLEPQTAVSNANAVNILGYSRAPALAAAVEAANSETDLTLRFRYDNNASNLLRRSDQWPYLQNNVPAVWFHTGLHPDYHTPDDDADRINYEKMTRIVRLIHQVSWNVANTDERFSVEAMGPRPPS
jgi:Zn-dependent M28 family amino/carboxypeptidase